MFKSKDEIIIVELNKSQAASMKLIYDYVTSEYYDLSMLHEDNLWKIEIVLKSPEKPIEKHSESTLFQEFIEEPRVFAAEKNGKQVGWVEVCYEKWNNRMRVWEILVQPEHRRNGIGTLLMKKAIAVARERGARMLVLETQSCNVPALNFYLKQGFELIGFDIAAYTNDDIQKHEMRLELGLKL